MTFDSFSRKEPRNSGYAPVNVTFTAEEHEVIERALGRYVAIANTETPEGMAAMVHKKVKDGMVAQGLTEYVENLMILLKSEPALPKQALMLDKGIKAMIKAYAVHNLPNYLFQVAAMFELLGDDANSKIFFQHFLEAENQFRPDDVDLLFLQQTGFDFARSIEIAREKIR